MSDTHLLDLDRSVSSVVATAIVLAAVAASGVAGAATSAVAQTPDEAEDDATSLAEIVMPEGRRILPGPGGTELLPDLPTFPILTTGGRDVDDRSALDAKLRATRTDTRLPSTRMYGVPFRLGEGPVSFGQTRGSWLSGGNKQLDGSSMGIFDVDLLRPVSRGSEDPRDSPAPR